MQSICSSKSSIEYIIPLHSTMIMASSTSTTKQGSAKKLSELLDEQQEPFVLEIYLHERGYRIRKSSEFESPHFNLGCCSTSINHYKNKNQFIPKKTSAQFSNMAKTLINKLVSKEKKKKSKNRREKMSNRTWSPTKIEKSAGDGGMNQWRIGEGNQQCSPNSVLDEIDLIQGMPVYNVRHTEDQNLAEPGATFQKKVSENAILSASLWELLVHFRGEKSKQLKRRKSFPEYMMNSSKSLQKDRQILFDCVREAVENGKQLKSSLKNRGKDLKIESKEIGKFMCKNFKISAHKPNIQKVLKKDLFEKGVADEWNGFELWKMDVVADIGDCIVDEIISELSDQFLLTSEI